MKKYTIEEIKKFLESEIHISAHVIQTEAVEMCRQLVGMLDTKVESNEKTEYRKLWHDRIDDNPLLSNKRIVMIRNVFEELVNILSQPNIDLKLKAKFDKGMEEHGMGFEKVDFDAEIENEVLDICNYLIGKNYIREFLEEQNNNPQSPETPKA